MIKKRILISVFVLGGFLVISPTILAIFKMKPMHMGRLEISSIGLAIVGIVLLLEYYTSNFVDRIFKHWAENTLGFFLILLTMTDFLPRPYSLISIIILDILTVIVLIYKRRKLKKELDESWKNVQIGKRRRRF